MLGVSAPGALNYNTLFCLIPLILFISRILTLIYLPLFRSLDSLLCDLIAPTLDLVFFATDVPDASGGVIIFVKQSLFSSELSTSSLSSLGPYSDYVEVNISPNDSSSLLFLNAYALLFVLLRRIAEPISFLFPFLPLCGSGGIFRASASASTEKDRFHIPDVCLEMILVLRTYIYSVLLKLSVELNSGCAVPKKICPLF